MKELEEKLREWFHNEFDCYTFSSDARGDVPAMTCDQFVYTITKNLPELIRLASAESKGKGKRMKPKI